MNNENIEISETFHQKTISLKQISENFGRAAAAFLRASESLKQSADKINDAIGVKNGN